MVQRVEEMADVRSPGGGHDMAVYCSAEGAGFARMSLSPPQTAFYYRFVHDVPMG